MLDLEILVVIIQVLNLWLDGPQDAMGEGPQGVTGDYKKNIPIIDDINDTGKTPSWIRDDWNAPDAWSANKNSMPN